MVSALYSGASGPGSSPGQGHCLSLSLSLSLSLIMLCHANTYTMKIKLQGHEITKDIYKNKRMTGEQLGETEFPY